MRLLVASLLAVLLALAGAGGGATAVAQEDGDGVQTATGLSEPIYEETVTEVYEIPTDHGTIYGEVIRPVVPEGVLVPVILTYSPYNIISELLNPGGSIAGGAFARYYVPRGYARAVFDVVGTRNSGGCYDYGGTGERETGRDVVDFLGTQPWSNGRVGMIGGSYDGTTQWAAAVEQPEHLVTIVPQVAIDRWYDYAYGGGIRYFLNNEDPSDEGFDTPLAFDFGFGLLPPTDVVPAGPGPSPAILAEAVEGRINPCERIEHTERAYEFDPVYDEFWVERDYHALAHRITASVMVEGGWLDHNVKHWDSTRMFMALPEDLPKRLVMGQWAHSSSQFDDAADIRHAWFDHWLLDLDTGIMDLPAVDTEPGGLGERVQEASWPPPGTVTAPLPLAGPVEEGAEPDVGTLALVGAEDATWAHEDPPTTEEELLSSTTSERDAYLHLQTAPLEQDVRISGSPILDLEVTSTAESTHFTPVLYTVDPDGAIAVVTRGFLNARNRDGLHVSEPLSVGEPYAAPVELWDTDYVVPAGHRLGIVVASENADWALPDDDPHGTNTLGLDGASKLLLPVSEGASALGVDPTAPLSVVRAAGAGRVETATAVSARSFDAAPTAVLATAEAYPDALAGAPLAVDLDAPLLLSASARLSAATAEELQRLGTSEVVLLGGEAALSREVEQDLAVLGIDVRRVAGADRFGTAAAIADELPASEGAVVVEGAHADPARGWPDAVSASPLAAATGRPVLLVTSDAVPAATAQALERRGVTATLVVGGTSAVSDAVVAELEDAGHGPTRLAGETRYATSARVHAAMVDAGGDPATTWLATGRDWPDALTGGAAVAHTGATLLLVDGHGLAGSPESRDRLASLAGTVREVVLLGGHAAIGQDVEDEVRALVAAPAAT